METGSAASSMRIVPTELEGSLNHVGRGSLGGVRIAWIEDGLVGITLTPGVRITTLQASQVHEQLIAAFNDQPFGLLLDVADVAAIDKDAVTLYAVSVSVTALAIVGRTPVDRVMAHRLLGLTSPQYPSRYFTSIPEALEWLRPRL